MRSSVAGVLVVLIGASIGACSSNPGGSGDPCTMVPVFTCLANDNSTCDEVYTASAQAELEPLCQRLGDISLPRGAHCPVSLQCCFNAVGGYGDGSQVHCVSTSVDSHYQTYCTSGGNTYCPR
jgi:hypothetical protein